MTDRALVMVLGWVVGLLSLSAAACSKDEEKPAPSAKVDAAAAAPAGPKNMDLAKAALATAKAKYAKHEVVDADCAPIRSLEADFAQDKSPEATQTRKEIDAFCEIDVKLEGEVATLKGDQAKLEAAQKKKDRAGEQMYGATVKDGCATVKQHLEGLAADHLDGEPKVGPLKAEVERLCAPAAARK
jgi:flagellar hook-length control protein FliK